MLGLCIEYKIGTLYSPRIMQYSQLFIGVAKEFAIWKYLGIEKDQLHIDMEIS